MCECDCVVEVEQGKLKGILCKTPAGKQFCTFKGIPYAKPPIGELRFSEPVPPESWEGIRDATKDCNICAQYDRDTGNVVGDEDCLYLNVYTPKRPNSESTSLPVMVFFHGGGFVFGHGTDESAHGPDFLIEKDVIIVSPNYRLGILGFLDLGRKEASGNMGLKDLVQALKWVKKNITKFGGDPDNVTIFGISAGGSAVEYLLLSPMAKGLFHKAIAQSGSSLLHWAQSSKVKQLASTIPARKGKSIADDEELLKYLQGLPISELIESSMTALEADKFKGGINFGFVPTIERSGDWEPFLNKSSYDLLSRGEFNKVPFMSGFSTREGLLMISSGKLILEKLVKDKNFLDYLSFDISKTREDEMNSRLNEIYLKQENVYNESDAFGIDFFTDVDFLGGIYIATSLIAKKNSPVYFYEFSYDGGLNYYKKKKNINRRGACHGDDGGYILKSKLLPDDISESDRIVRDRMLEMWTNFAKIGDPTPKVDDLITTKWEPIAGDRMGCLVIDDRLTMKYNIYQDRMKLFEELYKNDYTK